MFCCYPCAHLVVGSANSKFRNRPIPFASLVIKFCNVPFAKILFVVVCFAVYAVCI